VDREIVERARIDALQLIRGNRVQDHLEPETPLEGRRVQQVPSESECDRELTACRLKQQHRRVRRVEEVVECGCIRQVRSEKVRPPGRIALAWF
jgi:hypothetical protein